jgi:Fur family peroxide stress response transcriptional regulator
VEPAKDVRVVVTPIDNWYKVATGMVMRTVQSGDKMNRLREVCRSKGWPLTIQRRAILEEIQGNLDHPCADEVYAAVAGRVPGISRTTVYRVLEMLVSVGIVCRVAHAGGVVRYDPRTERHHHLVCKHCGVLVDLPDSAVRGVSLRGVGSPDFDISDYSIQFRGTCSRCRQRTPKASQERRDRWPRISRARRRTRI